MSPASFIDDPNWAKGIPEWRASARTRHVPAHEDCARVDPDSAAEHLRAGGTLGAMPGYEERPGQLDMLKAVVRAFDAREHLMVEAGTGVGKSLAYLVPAVLWSATNDTTVVVSTATRNLQGQLIGSDIPRAVRVLGGNAASFKVALLKGRANYLCLRAVGEFFAAGYWTMSDDEQAEMPHFIEWLGSTKDGDLDAYDGTLPRTLLSCPGEECAGRRCPYYAQCFVYRARKNAADANLLVVNHALVLADATHPGAGVLPPHARLVLDEAHNLESIATDYLSREFSLPALAHITNRLARKGRGRRVLRAGGVLSSVERQLQKGVLAGNPAAERIARLLGEAAQAMVRAHTATDALLDGAGALLAPVDAAASPRRGSGWRRGGDAASTMGGRRGGDAASTVRYRVTAEGVRCHSVRGLFKPYDENDWNEAQLIALRDRFEAELAGLVRILHDLRDTLNDSTPEGELNYCADLAAQLDGIAGALVDFANDAVFVLAGENDGYAFWAERIRVPKRPAYLRLVAAPLSVADPLAKLLYGPKDSVVLCSATLRVGNDFKYMIKRLGCTERFTALVAASPFDYLRQALVLAPDYLPDPTTESAKYIASLAELVASLVAEANGRTLVLFTSYEMMRSVADAVRGPLADAGYALLVQGEGLSREAMTARLKREAATVLFGAQSFWEGVDVAGEALSCVILARLPFQQVGDPIVEARSEKIDRDGGSSFRDYALPEAVIKFRQGFGRLIRTKRDRGVVVVADPRIATKNYGAIFRRSIPASVHTAVDGTSLLDRVRAFFAG